MKMRFSMIFRRFMTTFEYFCEVIDIFTSEDMEIQHLSPGCGFKGIFMSGVFSSKTLVYI